MQALFFCGYSDHIAISWTSGIFLVETRSLRGNVTTTDSEILVNGQAPEKRLRRLDPQEQLLDAGRNGAIAQSQTLDHPGVFTMVFVKFGKPVKGIHT